MTNGPGVPRSVLDFPKLSDADLRQLIEKEIAERVAPLRPTPYPFPWASALRTVGVTGTNGKSSTTTLTASALRADRLGVLELTTLGCAFDGQPLPISDRIAAFVRAARHAVDRRGHHYVAEVTSTALANGFARFWRFDTAVFTNLDRDHLNQHGSWEHYLASKAQLFALLGPGCVAILNADSEAARLIDQVTPPDVVRRWYSLSGEDADLQVTRADCSLEGTHFRFAPSEWSERLGKELVTQLVGGTLASNAIPAALAALSEGATGENVRRGIAGCPALRGRFEVIHQRPTVVIDFAHTPAALAAVCDAALSLCPGRLFVVFGAGGERDASKREPMGRVVGERAHRVFVTNDNPRTEDPRKIASSVERGVRRGGRAYVVVQLDRRQAIRRALNEARPNDLVLIAGKGHEEGQLVGGTVVPYSDHDVVWALVDANASADEPLRR
jgi:UDP-N-acetylmuramoyl-L-alanyl-D-glutamate--2,6-diaminopimelate ligase